jgi:hypothetical protein
MGRSLPARRYTIAEVREIAEKASAPLAPGGYLSMFKRLAGYAGFKGAPGGWIYYISSDNYWHPAAQGWTGFAGMVARGDAPRAARVMAARSIPLAEAEAEAHDENTSKGGNA